MQTDAYCQHCLAAVRRALAPEKRIVLLNPQIERKGDQWVVEFRDGLPILGSGEPPEGEPLRYKLHECLR